jgi:uncharacterized protein (DUF433 family)
MLSQLSPLTDMKPVSAADLAGDLVPSDHPLFGLIWINPQRLGGTPCFFGSRVPITTLFDYLEAGYSLNEFLEHFEGVTREQAARVLELAQSDLLQELPKP